MLLEASVAAAHVALLAYAPPTHWEVWATFIAFVAAVQVACLAAPGRLVVGVPYRSGAHSRHRANGVGVGLATVAAFSTAAYVGVVPANIVYVYFGEFLSVGGVVALFLSLYAPKELTAEEIEKRKEKGENLGVVQRILYGRESLPLTLPFNFRFDGLEQSRTAHLGLLLASLSIAAEQYDREVVRGLLQVQQLIFGVPLLIFLLFVTAFVTDRLLYETQEMSSVTFFTSRRTGLTRLWLIFVATPFISSLPVWWLIGDPRETLWPPVAIAAVALFGAGYTFYRGATAQKHTFRTRGPAASVWGERPLVIEAVHQPGDLADGVPVLPGMGTRRVLLVCGYWSLVRHPRALGLLLMMAAAAMLCVPSPAPWLLPAGFAVYMLVRLTRRIEPLLEAQYGPVWRRYCSLAPRMLFPQLL